MKLPSIEYCNDLFVRHHVTSSVRRHCEAVTKVGITIARHLQQAGVGVDIELVEIICRVHDAFKPISLPYTALETSEQIVYWSAMREKHSFINDNYETEIPHETIVAANELKEEYPDFSDIVSNIGSTNNPRYLDKSINHSLELRVAHYADWRVQNDTIIPFDNRLKYLFETWAKGITESQWEERKRQEKLLENEIFDYLDFEPDDLAQVVYN